MTDNDNVTTYCVTPMEKRIDKQHINIPYALHPEQ